MVWITIGISIVSPLPLGMYGAKLPSPSINFTFNLEATNHLASLYGMDYAPNGLVRADSVAVLSYTSNKPIYIYKKVYFVGSVMYSIKPTNKCHTISNRWQIIPRIKIICKIRYSDRRNIKT